MGLWILGCKFEAGSRKIYSRYMHVFIRLVVLGLICLGGTGFARLSAQGSLKDSALHMASIELTYQGIMPQGVLRNRFGYSSFAGVVGGYKSQSNWLFTAGFLGLFTDAVQEVTMFNGIITPSGFFVGDDGLLASANIQGRGWMVPVTMGKVFSGKFSPNPNSGIFVEAGGQFLLHRIWARPVGADVAAIEGANRKGYDRLTSGFGVSESVGYRYLGNKGYVNFSFALTASQNFTRGRRSVQFDTGLPYEENRQDTWAGFVAKWIFPVYSRAPEKVYFR